MEKLYVSIMLILLFSISIQLLIEDPSSRSNAISFGFVLGVLFTYVVLF